MNTMTSKMGRGDLQLWLVTPGCTTYWIYSILGTHLECYLHPLDTVEVFLKLEEVLVLKSMSLADDMHKSVQQQDLSSRPFLQDKQQVLSLSAA